MKKLKLLFPMIAASLFFSFAGCQLFDPNTGSSGSNGTDSENTDTGGTENSGPGSGSSSGNGTVSGDSTGGGIDSLLSGYHLVWNDEFDRSDADGTPLSDNWWYDIGNGWQACSDGKNPNNDRWGNGELQWYSDNNPKNTYVSDGTLKIVARKEVCNGMNYTSGRIVTRGLNTFKYGYIEMSAKIPNDRGVWPAFWMLNNDIYDGNEWPKSGEIDIMESSVNLWQSDTVYGTLHCNAGFGGSPVFSKKASVKFSDGKFHKYAVNWDDDHIDWYYDDVKVFTYTPVSYDTAPWPFNDEFYIIINLAVGGGLGGNVPADFTSSTMEIDYVRVWQKDSGYTDRNDGLSTPTSTVTKTIPSGAKIIYDSKKTSTYQITGGDVWNGGWAWKDYNAGNDVLKQIEFQYLKGENSCGGWNLSPLSYSANSKLHLSVYAGHNFRIKPVKPDKEFFTTVSPDGEYQWIDVEIDLGAADTLTQLGFVSTVVQTIWVDHVYITE